mgnify:CR=1 FL=1
MTQTDELLFKKAEKAILTNKLYLKEDMSRELVNTFVHIPKNKFAPIFRKFTGKSFPAYVNSLRMAHAAELLKQHPEYKIESIALECGITVAQTFYRLFKAEFGITPSAFKRQYAK